MHAPLLTFPVNDPGRASDRFETTETSDRRPTQEKRAESELLEFGRRAGLGQKSG